MLNGQQHTHNKKPTYRTKTYTEKKYNTIKKQKRNNK